MRMPTGQKGSVLVQTIIMGILMAMIAGHLIEWSFGRAQMVRRHQDVVTAGGDAEGCLNQIISSQFDRLAMGTSLVSSNVCTSGASVIYGSGGRVTINANFSPG